MGPDRDALAAAYRLGGRAALEPLLALGEVASCPACDALLVGGSAIPSLSLKNCSLCRGYGFIKRMGPTPGWGMLGLIVACTRDGVRV